VFRFAIDPTGAPSPGMVFGRRAESHVLETDGYRLEVDPRTGAIAELVNKATGRAVFSGPAHRAFVAEDGTDTWGHGTHSFPFAGEALALEGLRAIDEGPLRRSLEVTGRCGESRVSTVVVLPGDAVLPVELRVTVDWREKGKLLRFAYPLGSERFEYEVPAGWQARPDVGHEVPGLRWVRAVGPEQTVAMVNDAKYSYAAREGVLDLTALRSPVFSHHDPVALREDAFLRYMDQGVSSFVVRLRSGAEISRREVQVMADELTKPPVVTTHVARHGAGAHVGTWLDLGVGENVVVTTLKTAEDTDDVIVRALELKTAEDTDDVIVRALELDGRAWRVGGVALHPRRIATLRLRGDELSATDGLESGGQ
jgi:alpha-mannosidase